MSLQPLPGDWYFARIAHNYNAMKQGDQLDLTDKEAEM